MPRPRKPTKLRGYPRHVAHHAPPRSPRRAGNYCAAWRPAERVADRREIALGRDCQLHPARRSAEGRQGDAGGFDSLGRQDARRAGSHDAGARRPGPHGLRVLRNVAGRSLESFGATAARGQPIRTALRGPHVRSGVWCGDRSDRSRLLNSYFLWWKIMIETARGPGGRPTKIQPEWRPMRPFCLRSREIRTGGQVPESRPVPCFYVEKPGR